MLFLSPRTVKRYMTLIRKFGLLYKVCHKSNIWPILKFITDTSIQISTKSNLHWESRKEILYPLNSTPGSTKCNKRLRPKTKPANNSNPGQLHQNRAIAQPKQSSASTHFCKIRSYTKTYNTSLATASAQATTDERKPAIERNGYALPAFSFGPHFTPGHFKWGRGRSVGQATTTGECVCVQGLPGEGLPQRGLGGVRGVWGEVPALLGLNASFAERVAKWQHPR